MSKNILRFVAYLLTLLVVLLPFQAAVAQDPQPFVEVPSAPVISSGQPVTSTTLQPSGGSWYNTNLIPDGDAESDLFANYWQDNEGFSSMPAYGSTCGASCGFPSPYDPGPTLRGKNFFFMGYTTNHSAQTNIWIKNKIPVSLIQSTINTGLVRYIVSGYFGGYSAQSDTAQLHVFFEGGNGSSLAQVIVGNVTPSQRNNKTGLVYRQMTGYIPKDTTNINMVLQSGTLSGSDYRTGFADNLSLILVPVQTFLPAISQPSSGEAPARTSYPAPSGISVIPDGLTRMNISWTDNTSNEQGFEIQRINPDQTADTVCNTRPDVTECLDPGISASAPYGYIYLGSQVSYTYKVRSIGPIVNSDWASGAGTTALQPSTPPVPTNGTFTCQSLATTSTSTTFVWNDPFNYEAGFNIYVGNNLNPSWSMIEGGTKISFINQVPGTITLTIKPFVYDRTNPLYVHESSTSCTATAVLPSPSSNGISRFANNTSYPVISLVVDGWEQFPVRPLAILPGSYYEMSGVPLGSHTWTATTGFWDDYAQRFAMYNYSGAYNQPASGTANINIPDMSIQDLLTIPPTNKGYWEGYYWDANLDCHTAAFNFTQSGNYTFYIGNVAQGTGTYSLIQREPSIFSVKFHVSGLPAGTDALLIETHGMFYLKNGPASWSQITYTYKPQGYVYNAFCP